MMPVHVIFLNRSSSSRVRVRDWERCFCACETSLQSGMRPATHLWKQTRHWQQRACKTCAPSFPAFVCIFVTPLFCPSSRTEFVVVFVWSPSKTNNHWMWWHFLFKWVTVWTTHVTQEWQHHIAVQQAECCHRKNGNGTDSVQHSFSFCSDSCKRFCPREWTTKTTCSTDFDAKMHTSIWSMTNENLKTVEQVCVHGPNFSQCCEIAQQSSHFMCNCMHMLTSVVLIILVECANLCNSDVSRSLLRHSIAQNCHFRQLRLMKINDLMTSVVCPPNWWLFVLWHFHWSVHVAFLALVITCHSFDPHFLIDVVWHGQRNTSSTFLFISWSMSHGTNSSHCCCRMNQNMCRVQGWGANAAS